MRQLADELLAAVDASPNRFLLGITGPPGAGKTMLAEALEQIVSEQRGEAFAIVAPMDGFHLRNEILDARGLRAVKGAPETFNVEGFVAGHVDGSDLPNAELVACTQARASRRIPLP